MKRNAEQLQSLNNIQQIRCYGPNRKTSSRFGSLISNVSSITISQRAYDQSPEIVEALIGRTS